MTNKISSFLAPGAKVLGDVTLGKRSSIWYNAVLRGDSSSITIGADSNIQDNCTIHTDTSFPVVIGNGVSIGHGAIVHGCSIDDNTVIGMGSILLNGCHVGKNCIIGAGSLITGNKQIPDNSLVYGNPGKIIRTVTDSEIRSNQENAAHYVMLAEEQTK